MLKKIVLKDIYEYFFYLFIFFLPFQTRRVFLTDYSFYTGSFTEYGAVFLYFSDILLLLALFFFGLYNWSVIKNSLYKLKTENTNREKCKIFLLLGSLLLWFIIGFAINFGYPELTLFKILKIFEMFLLFGMIYIIFDNQKIITSSLFMLVLSAYFQGLLAIYQFIYQKNLFETPLLHKLTGETILSPNLPGIAKITIDGQKTIRAYGTFPHPNILGGFLIFSLFVSLYLYIKHKDDKLSSKLPYLKTINNKTNNYLLSLFWLLIFTVQLLGIFFSFSRSAWVGTLIASFIFTFFYVRYIKIVSRETIFSCANISKWFNSYKELFLGLILILIFAGININLVLNRAVQDVSLSQYNQNIILPQNDTFNDRNFFNNVSRETIFKNPVFGSGLGTSIFQIKNYLNKTGQKNIESWQYQPAHNIYLLVASEIGLVGLVVFLFIIFKILRVSIKEIVSRETISRHKVLKLSILSVLVSFLFIGCFDHYLWTIQQGELIFWITLAILMV